MAGWSLARIQHEAHKRAWADFGNPHVYIAVRDGARAHDWVWAVDWLWHRMEIPAPHHAAAKRYYEAKQVLRGDAAPEKTGMALHAPDGESAHERAARIAACADGYVQSHPDLTPFRFATFEALFHHKQPTLERMRTVRPPHATGRGRAKQTETIRRIKWCVEVLANHFEGQPYEGDSMNEKLIGVGEGWKLCPYNPGQQAQAVAALEAQGLQTFVAPRSGNVYWRNPHEASVFEPLDASPQISASKR